MSPKVSLRQEELGGAIFAFALVVTYYLLPFDRAWIVCSVAGLILVLGMGPFVVHRLRRVQVSERPVIEAALSLLLTLTILVTSFAAVYYTLATNTHDQMTGIATKTDAFYFTVTMVSTVGFGDITATGQAARALVTANMVVNLVFLGLTLRMLTWAVQQRAR